ncbi:unnamed protein product [Cyclocybe aegerita]|uniref:Utp14-domain-containing protein n=1 Tax=Cyclocybe aegerita TaxID=1973307 RepID=A0A8S0WKY0_CYCAE|nr:unnamed protein product [Cyclocybe aegerita]
MTKNSFDHQLFFPIQSLSNPVQVVATEIGAQRRAKILHRFHYSDRCAAYRPEISGLIIDPFRAKISRPVTQKTPTTTFPALHLFAPTKSRAAANVAGYEKRQARKVKSTSASDLYEHIQEKSRRSRVGLDLDREEALEYGVGLDGANEEEREELRASEGAFEESDEERFAGFFSSKKKPKSTKRQKGKTSVRFAEVDLKEDEDMSSVAEGKRNGKGDIDMGSDDEKMPSRTSDASSSRPSVGEEGQENGDEDGSEKGSDDEDEDEDEDENMSFALQITTTPQKHVATKKRKAPEEEAVGDVSESRVWKRRLMKEKTEAGEESEFRVQSTGAKLNLEDLLAPLASQLSTLQSLKKSTKVLASSNKAKILSAPLPQRAQDRLDRQAAYEQTKQEVDKWSETMKRIKEAEHLSFPLQAQPTGRISNLELNAKFKPTTELESAVDSLLKSANLREEDIHETEESMLKTNNLSVEEVAERRNELRKMRELMFRAEIKARRVSKIKSKTYRRLRRKEKERLGEKIDEQEESDSEESRLKREMERARERATLRHKHTGKWAKKMKGREDVDENTRKDIEDMLTRGEKLRRRIQGAASDESGDDEDEDEEDEDDGDVEGAIAKIKQNAFDELQKLQDDDEDPEDGKMGKSVFEMKFMKAAMARQAVAANREVDDFIKEMGGYAEGADDSDAEAAELREADPSSGVVVARAGGRVVYRPGAAVNPWTSNSRTKLAQPPPSDTSSVTLRSTDLLSPPPPSPTVVKRSGLSAPAPSADASTSTSTSTSAPEPVNPWLVRPDDDSSSAKVAKKANTVMVGKDSKATDKSKNKLKKQTQKLEEEREKKRDDAVVEIDVDAVLTLPMSSNLGGAGPSKAKAVTTIVPASGPSAKKAAKGKQAAAPASPGIDDDDDDSDANSELDAQEKALNLKGKGTANGLKAFEQRDLVALAFAGDNVVQSFEEAKRREIASDAPKEVDTTIPGWGSWGGQGTNRAPPKPQRIKKIAGIDPTTRADYGKKHVIISEKRDKKAAKYLVKDLPYPYTSQAQFERAMEQPLGVEWNTRVGFQRATLPRVVKKPGIIIEPLEKVI